MSNDKPAYDFEFLCGSLGVVPYYGGAFNASKIIHIQTRSPFGITIIFDDGFAIELNIEECAELEATIRRGHEIAKEKQREAIKENIRAQMELAAELQGELQQKSAIVVPTLQRKRGSA